MTDLIAAEPAADDATAAGSVASLMAGGLGQLVEQLAGDPAMLRSIIGGAGPAAPDLAGVLVRLDHIEATLAIVVQQLATLVAFTDGLKQAASANPVARRFLAGMVG